MKSLFLLTFAFLLSFVAASNSGIYEDDHQTISQPPSVEANIDVGRREPAPNFAPTPSRRLTNAERLRRGLPLLPPSRRSGALSPRASCVPLSTGSGKIQVRKASDQSILGYIRQQFDGQNSYTFGTLANALSVQLGSTDSNDVGGAIEISAVNGPDAAHPFVGAVGGSGGYNFNPGQLGYAYLSGTGHTPANAPPSSSAGHSIQALGYNAPAESTIWKVNCLTGQVTAQWTNADSSQPSTSIFYDPPVDFVGLVGDFTKFTQTFPGEGAYLVTLWFIPGL